MDMLRQRLAPGVQDGQHAHLAAQLPFWVQPQCTNGAPGGFEEQIVNQRLIVSSDPIQFMWDGKHHVEVLNWQQLGFALRKPAQLFDRLTLGAMPIAAGVILHLGCTTMRAGVYVPTQY